MPMTTGPAGKQLIRASEGLSLAIKPDNKGPQIGYGHDLTASEIASGVYAGGITAAQAEAILDNDLATQIEPAVNRMAPWANQNEFDALISFCYNEGTAHLATMLGHGQTMVPIEMPYWVYAEIKGVETKLPALETRRAAEVALFVLPVPA